MITEFNKYISDEPKVGDYVIVDEPFTWTDNNDFVDFISNNVGKLVAISNHFEIKTHYMVTFDNIPDIFIENFSFSIRNIKTRAYYIEQIKIWSDKKKDFDSYFLSKKYNL